MLKHLEISNYALIENVSLDLSSGYTVITGDTGAGKSIILKALNLLLGDRADTSVLKQNENKCFLEAEFDIKGLALQSFFEEHELDYEDQCILRREFNASGKSRTFINDTPVQLTQLKQLGEKLVSIHSQHQTLDVLDTSFQMQILDAAAGNLDLVSNYNKEYRIYRDKVNEHIQLQVKDMENRKEKDYLEFLINELKMADLDNTNIEELKGQNDRLENAEKIIENLGLAKSVFENETYGPLNGIKTLIETFEELKSYDSKYSDIHARLLSLKIEMDDLSSEIENHETGFDFSNVDAESIKEKMDLLNSLIFKHNLSSVEELKALQDELTDQMSEIDSLEDRMNQLAQEIESCKSALNKKAAELDANRKKAIAGLESEVQTRLGVLAMPEAELKIELETYEKLGPNGFNEVAFLFKTNKGGAHLPIKKVASGGELSRLMLTILSILSEHQKLPTLIFDEIDTGVSGEVAAKIAAEFVKMGNRIQLIAITHLAQVAAKGARHLHVAKRSDNERTTTTAVELDGDERVDQLAKMISGEQVTDAARENALHLLKV